MLIPLPYIFASTFSLSAGGFSFFLDYSLHSWEAGIEQLGDSIDICCWWKYDVIILDVCNNGLYTANDSTIKSLQHLNFIDRLCLFGLVKSVLWGAELASDASGKKGKHGSSEDIP